MTNPNFFIVGAEKCATTSLYHYLKQHPNVFFPEYKEPGYYSGKYNRYPHNSPQGSLNDKPNFRRQEEYLKIFNKAKNQKVIGDSTVNNLYYSQTAYDIKSDFPDAKILISLRNPIDRAYSAYMHLVRAGQESFTFEEGIKKEEERRNLNYTSLWNYIDGGKYYSKVKTFVDVFGQDKVKVIFYEDIKHNLNNVLYDIYNFLAVDTTIEVNTSIKFNATGTPKLKTLHKFITQKNIIKTILKPMIPRNVRIKSKNYIHQKNLMNSTMNSSTRSQLTSVFMEDIQRLEKLLDKDLSHWIS